MVDVHFLDAVEADFREAQWLPSEVAENAVALAEAAHFRFLTLNLRAEATTARLAGTWHSEERFEALPLVPLEPSPSGFVILTSDARIGSVKFRRVKISRTRQGHETAPAELRFSQKTLDLVRRGFRLRASSLEALLENNAEEFDVSDEQLSSFIGERLMLTFGGVADFVTQSRNTDFTIAYEGNFIGAIDVLLQSRIPNVPKEFSVLSNSICSDIVRHLRDGGRVEAFSWKLKMNGSGVVLAATGTRVSPPQPIGRAKLIE